MGACVVAVVRTHRLTLESPARELFEHAYERYPESSDWQPDPALGSMRQTGAKFSSQIWQNVALKAIFVGSTRIEDSFVKNAKYREEVTRNVALS